MKKILTCIFIAVIVICAAISIYTIFLMPAETPIIAEVKPTPVVHRVTAPEQSKTEYPPGYEKKEPVVPKLPEGENVALKKKVESGLHTDVYVPKNVNDGNVLTYWEGADFPNTVKIDLAGTYKIRTAVIMLNPAAIWGPRTQTFEIQASLDGQEFTTIVPSTQYQFDPNTGNLAVIEFEPTEAAYVQFIFTQNSGTFEKGGQAAEICLYE